MLQYILGTGVGLRLLKCGPHRLIGHSINEPYHNLTILAALEVVLTREGIE